jgi:16S rRNA (guanine527-N7)-methyltransferase
LNEASESQTSLAEELARLPFTISPQAGEQFERYCQLLWDWNQKINLTRHTNYSLFVSRDVLDSWHLAQQLRQGERVLDVGSGGGVPGILIAILRPDLEVSLSESTGKKAKVLESLVRDLALKVTVYASRAEAVLAERSFDVVTARAVGSIARVCQWLQGRWPAIGRLLMIKGPQWIEERGEARHLGLLKSLELRKVDSYPMPGTTSESVILKLWPKGQPEV